MAYTVYKNTTTVLTTIEVGETDDQSCSLTLIGKNVNNYGEYVNQNFVDLLSNFAGTTQPEVPLEGQIWYDSQNKRIYVYEGAGFEPIYGADVQPAEPVAASIGDLWFKDTTDQLYVFDGTSHKLIGPSVSPGLGKFGIEPVPFNVFDFNSSPRQRHTPSLIYSYGRYIGLISTTTFVLEPSTSSVILNEDSTFKIEKGLNIFEDLNVKGDLYINQVNINLLPKKYLSAYYDITRFGSIETLSTETNLRRYNAANSAISNVLGKMFTTNDVERYSLSSEVTVACDFTEMVTATYVTSTVDTGSTVIVLTTTSNISAGAIVQGSDVFPVGTIVEVVSATSVVLNLPTIGTVPAGTPISFNRVTTQPRLFRLESVDPNSNQWKPYEIYTRSLLNWEGTMTVTNTVTSTITVEGIQTGFFAGLQIEFTGGKPQPTIGLTTVSNTVTNLTTTNLELQTQGLGVATSGTEKVIFNAHVIPFIATYTNIVP
jgi:hypothetical protein